MYEAHFGLRERPFVETTDPGAYVALPSREAALRRLSYGVDRGPGAVLIDGAAGTGKSMLARVLAERRGGPCVQVNYPLPTAEGWLALLADEWHAPRLGGSAAAADLRRARAAVAGFALRGERPIVVVDDVQLIAADRDFEVLRLLLSLDADGRAGLCLVLVGGEGTAIGLPNTLAERITAHGRLGLFEEAETGAYVTGRLAAAGATRTLFDGPALAALHDVTDGMPRRLNLVADLALLIAFARGEMPDSETVARAAREGVFNPLAA